MKTLTDSVPGSVQVLELKPYLANNSAAVGWGLGSEPPSLYIPLAMPDFVTRLSYLESTTGDKNKWNPCSHYSRTAIPESITMLRHRSEAAHYGSPEVIWYREGDYPSSLAWSASNFGFPDSPLLGLQEMYSISGGDLFIPPPENLAELLDAAHVAILPNIRPQLSLLNTILELKDFKSIGKTVAHMADTVKRLDKILVSFGKNIGDSYRFLTPRELLRRSGDAYLQYRFNIAPLLSDIDGLLKTISRFKHKSRRLVQQSERNRVRHWSKDITADYEQTEQTDTRGFSLGANIQKASISKRVQLLNPAKFHVELLYSYYYTEFQKQHAALLSALDMIGINLNPAIVWNAIPFSFIVDWVVGIGPALNRFAMSNMEPVIVIQKSLWSISRERAINCTVSVDGLVGVPVSFVRERAYRRSPYQMSYHSVNLSGLDLREVSLMSALVSTRIRTY